MIESGIEFEAFIPEVKINSQKNDNGTISITAGWTAYDIYKHVDMVAKEIYDKFDADLLDKLMEMNGYVKERTCKNVSRDYDFICSECGAEVFATTYTENADVCVYQNDKNVGIKFCPACGARVID